MTESLRRVYAVWLRHFYILRGSVARMLEVCFWPTGQMVIWGFISQFFASTGATTLSQAFAMMLGVVLLWDMMFRTQIGLTVSYLEETWARNMGHLFVSPLRLHEWAGAMMLFGLFRAVIGMGVACLLAFPFYGFSIFDLGLPLIAYFLNLAFMGWWLGLLIISLLLKTGPGGESLAWMTAFAISPFCGVYYPLDILPDWMQQVGAFVPASHVFAGLRDLVQNHVFTPGPLLQAFALNVFYMAVAGLLLRLSFTRARRRGALLNAGE